MSKLIWYVLQYNTSKVPKRTIKTMAFSVKVLWLSKRQVNIILIFKYCDNKHKNQYPSPCIAEWYKHLTHDQKAIWLIPIQGLVNLYCKYCSLRSSTIMQIIIIIIIIMILYCNSNDVILSYQMLVKNHRSRVIWSNVHQPSNLDDQKPVETME